MRPKVKVLTPTTPGEFAWEGEFPEDLAPAMRTIINNRIRMCSTPEEVIKVLKITGFDVEDCRSAQ